MSNHDLDWLAAQEPQRTEIDHAARERALLALIQHSSRTGRARLQVGSLVRPRMVGLAAATAAVAAAAVLVLSTAGSGGGAAPLGDVAAHHHGSAVSPRVRLGQGARGRTAAVHHHTAATSPLVRLAAFVGAAPSPAGDATLVARTTTGGGTSVTVYDLYADDGQYFFSPTRSDLAGQISAHNDQADGLFAREVAAAKLAATGDVQKAAQDMADAPDPGHVVSPTQTASPRDIAAKEAADRLPAGGEPVRQLGVGELAGRAHRRLG